MTRTKDPTRLVADLATIQAAVRVTKKCAFGALLDEVTEEERTAIEEALGDSKIPTLKILAVLRRNGHRLGDNTLYHHRRQICTCFDTDRGSK